VVKYYKYYKQCAVTESVNVFHFKWFLNKLDMIKIRLIDRDNGNYCIGVIFISHLYWVHSRGVGGVKPVLQVWGIYPEKV